MNHRITRRSFAAAGAAAAFGLPVLETTCLAAAPEPVAPAADGFLTRPVRPFQLMCVVCRLGADCTDDLGEPRLTALLKAVRVDPKLPLTLHCNVDTVFRRPARHGWESRAEGHVGSALFSDPRCPALQRSSHSYHDANRQP